MIIEPQVALRLTLALIVACLYPARALAEQSPQPSAASVLQLDLRTVLRLARTRPPGVLAAEESRRARREDLAAAQHAWLPTVALLARGDYGHRNHAAAMLRTNAGHATHHADLTASFNLLDFGRRTATTRAATHALEAADSDLRSERLAASVTAAELYLRIVASTQLQALLQDALTEREKLLEAVNALVERGLRPAVDIPRTQAEIARARLELQVQGQSMERDSLALAAALGHTLATRVSVQPAPEAAFDIDADPLRAARLCAMHDPELAAARAREAQAQALVTRARAELLPELQLEATAAADRIDRLYGDTLRATDLAASGGLVLSWSVLDVSLWDRANAAAGDAAAAQKLAAQTALDRQREAAQTAYAVRQAKLQLDTAQQIRAALELTVQAERERYVLGQASLLEVLDAVENWQRARYDQISASYEHDNARVRLKLLTQGLAAFDG